MLLTEIQAKTEGSRNFAKQMMPFTCMAVVHSHMLRLATTIVHTQIQLMYQVIYTTEITYSPIQTFVTDFQMRMHTVNGISAQCPWV
jgi:hypothetical protein